MKPKAEAWLAIVGGILANVLPVIGWLSVYLGALAGGTTGHSGAVEGAMFGILVSLVLGGIGAIGWICGVVGTIIALARGNRSGLVFGALALNVAAVIGWVIEWAILLAVVDANKGAFRM